MASRSLQKFCPLSKFCQQPLSLKLLSSPDELCFPNTLIKRTQCNVWQVAGSAGPSRVMEVMMELQVICVLTQNKDVTTRC